MRITEDFYLEEYRKLIGSRIGDWFDQYDFSDKNVNL